MKRLAIGRKNIGKAPGAIQRTLGEALFVTAIPLDSDFENLIHEPAARP
jgi:hypothetical protein